MVRRPTLFQLHSGLSSGVGLTTNPDLYVDTVFDSILFSI